jgi:hypothetical protein
MQMPGSEGADICCQLGVSLQAEGVRGEDSRIAFTIGAIFLIPHGEAVGQRYEKSVRFRHAGYRRRSAPLCRA